MKGISRLARELQLSYGTISRALNNKSGVNAETRRKVLEAAERLGYEPNQAARSLASGRTGSVGFMIDLDHETAASGDNFFIGIFDGVQSELTPHGLDLLVLPCPSRQDKFAYLDRVVSRRLVDGMILSGIEPEDARIELLQSVEMTFVTMGRTALADDYSWVDLDFEGVAEAAVDRLVAQGHQRIAVTVPTEDLNFGRVFKNAFAAALGKHRIAFDPELVFQTGLGEEDGYDIVDQLLDRPRPATAILLLFEVAAIGIYRRLAERNLTPGVDLAIIGFRDEAIIRHLRPGLTCFDLSLHEAGRALATALLPQLDRPKQSGAPVHFKVPMEIMVRESDGPQ